MESCTKLEDPQNHFTPHWQDWAFLPWQHEAQSHSGKTAIHTHIAILFSKKKKKRMSLTVNTKNFFCKKSNCKTVKLNLKVNVYTMCSRVFFYVGKLLKKSALLKNTWQFIF